MVVLRRMLRSEASNRAACLRMRSASIRLRWISAAHIDVNHRYTRNTPAAARVARATGLPIPIHAYRGTIRALKPHAIPTPTPTQVMPPPMARAYIFTAVQAAFSLGLLLPMSAPFRVEDVLADLVADDGTEQGGKQ